MSKQLLVVFGATGNQGGSVAHTVLDDPELSTRYSVRAITRDPSTPKAQSLLSKGAALVAADLDDPTTLPAALKNANFVFAITTTNYAAPNLRETETRQAKAICDEAVQQGASYLIWSSMSHPSKITNGQLKNAVHFDVKAEIETYIRSLPLKSAFFAPGSFMQNYITRDAPRPSPANDGTYVLPSMLRADTKIPLIDISETGAWVGAILAEPDAYEGKFLAAAEGLYTLEEVAETFSRVTGKTVRYVQVGDEVFKGFLPEGMREPVYEMYVLFREFGYFGEGMGEMVGWARGRVRGEVSNFEGFLKREGFKLE